MEIRLDGSSVFLAHYGKPFDPARPTVLFVHGAGMDHSVWPLQARHFAYRGWNALAVDLPGHGRSGGELLGSVPAMAGWLGDLIQVLRAPVVHLVGHSMGALIGLDLAARHPDRIAGLVLLGAAPRMPVHPALLEAAARPEPLAAELICDWGFGPAGHFGGHKAPGSWMLGHALRLTRRVERTAPAQRPCRLQRLPGRAAGSRHATLSDAGRRRRRRSHDSGAPGRQARRGDQRGAARDPARMRAHADDRAAGGDPRCVDRISGK
jgi:pimeloyl-ACP methyl ester carboxylesterase